MAPTKRKALEAAEGEASSGAITRSAGASFRRVTRSLALRDKVKLTEIPKESPKRRNKGKAAVKPKGKRQAKLEPEQKQVAPETESPENVHVEESVEGKADEENSDDDKPRSTIIVEHCTQCQRFKRRANEVKTGLESAVAGVTVKLNPVKPRRGCFEIRVEDGEKFVSLLEMKRPFKPMMDLNMEKVIADVVSKVKP